MAKYRLYIDESGTHSYSKSDAVGKRYLGITGIIISEEEVISKLQPALFNLKMLVTKDPDEHITLHREEIANRKGHYSALLNPDVEREWNKHILSIVGALDYCVCTVVIDKKWHQSQYVAPMHPYHYCLHILLERYVTFLERKGATGDVMAEVRGKVEDTMLQQEYAHVYGVGTGFVKSSRFQAALTSNKMKLKPKDAIAGLELADLIVLASTLDVLLDNGRIPKLHSKFINQLRPLLTYKYYRNPSNGVITGYGKKFLGQK
jgi:hypothetical protein